MIRKYKDIWTHVDDLNSTTYHVYSIIVIAQGYGNTILNYKLLYNIIHADKNKNEKEKTISVGLT